MVEFDVTYQLGEYRQFVIDHVGQMSRRRPGFFTRMFVTAIAVPSYLFKSAKLGRCSFRIDAAGITRRSSHRELRIAASEVVAVHRYTRGYLVQKEAGAMPIPYRCLDASQTSALEALMAAWTK